MNRARVGFVVLAMASATGAAQAGAQSAVTVRPVDPPIASTTGTFGFIDRVIQLANGRVLVNDAEHRQLLAYTATLDSFTVVVDSARKGARGYGPMASTMIPYVGDSTLLIDGTSLSMLVIDPEGRVARVAAAPGGQALARMGATSAGFDRRGRMVFRGSFGRMMNRPGSGSSGPPLMTPDSAPLIAYDLDTRLGDTLALLRIPKTLRVTIQEGDIVRMRSVAEPFPLVDDATVLRDGRVAVVRGRDYRVDFLSEDGTLRRGPRISFPWQRVTDEEKARIVDSIGTASVTIADIPDYRPALRPGSARVDMDGHLWVRTTMTLVDQPGAVWDVIDAEGRLVRRILVPPGRGIIGFGTGGIVYLASRDGAVTRIEKVRARID